MAALPEKITEQARIAVSYAMAEKRAQAKQKITEIIGASLAVFGVTCAAVSMVGNAPGVINDLAGGSMVGAFLALVCYPLIGRPMPKNVTRRDARRFERRIGTIGRSAAYYEELEVAKAKERARLVDEARRSEIFTGNATKSLAAVFVISLVFAVSGRHDTFKMWVYNASMALLLGVIFAVTGKIDLVIKAAERTAL